MPESIVSDFRPPTRLERLTLAAAMTGVAAANASLWAPSPWFAAPAVSVAWIAAIWFGYRVASRYRAHFAPRVQGGVMCLALLAPLIQAFGLGEVGRLDALVVEGLRNLCAASAIFTFEPVRRRATLFVGLLLTSFVFTLDGSLLVSACALAQLAITVFWLAANDQRRWQGETQIESAPWRADFVAFCLLLASGGFMATALLYPSDQNGQDQALDRLLGGESRNLNAKQIGASLEEQSEVLEEASNKKYGQAATKQKNDEDENRRAERGDRLQSFTTQRTPPQNDAEFRTLFQIAGDQVRHIPTTEFDQFDGLQWQAEPGMKLPSVSAQIDGQTGFQKLVNRHDLDFAKFRGDVNVNSAEFLEQMRSLAAQSLTQDGVGTLHPQLQNIPPHQLQALMLEAPQWSSDATLLFTPYDVQALADAVKADPTLAWKMIARASDGDQSNDTLLHELQSLRARHGGPLLPPEMADLLKRWTADTEPGWRQIMAVVSGLRSHAEYDPTAIVPSDESDSVRYFLLQSRRGPDYLFASSAVVLLRALGYPSRLVGGYYADAENRSWLTGKTRVSEQDVHYWAQVMLADKIWVDIEPTPGFEIPSASAAASPGWRQSFDKWLSDYGPVTAAVVLIAILALVTLRRRVVGLWIYWRWRLGLRRGPREIVACTQRLIDYRLRQAGRVSPVSASFRAAVLPLAPHEPALRRFAELGRQAVYRDENGRDPAFRGELRTAAVQLVAWLTPRRVRDAASGV